MIEMRKHADLAVLVGQLHGVDPAGNLFLVPLTGDQVIIGTIRVRMADPAEPAATVRVVATAAWELIQQRWDAAGCVAVVAFGPASAADPVIDLAVRTLHHEVKIQVFDVLRVDAGRCWSWMCDEHGRDSVGQPVNPVADAAIQLATELGQQQ